jgi:hypothetical protein
MLTKILDEKKIANKMFKLSHLSKFVIEWAILLKMNLKPILSPKFLIFIYQF